MANLLVRSACRAYRLLLYSYPAEFRREYGDAMTQVFGDRLRAVASNQGLAGLLGFGVDTAADWLSTTIQEGITSMRSAQSAGATVHPIDGVPVFYTCDDEVPPARALIHGGLLSVVAFAFISFLIGHGGNHRFWLIGSHHPSRSHLLPVSSAAVPTSDLAAEVKVNPYPEEPELLPYFRAILVLGALDRDRNGAISAAEIVGAPAALRTLDKNFDGSLDSEECGQRLGGVPMDDGLRKRARLGFMRVHPVLAALDSDRDGVISASEMRHASAALRTLDRNSDRQLTLDELLPDPIAAQVGRIVIPLDNDGDGKLSKLEMSKVSSERIRAILAEADSNHDGTVTEAELANELRMRAERGEEELSPRGGLAKGARAPVSTRKARAPQARE